MVPEHAGHNNANPGEESGISGIKPEELITSVLDNKPVSKIARMHGILTK
jgi:hypothetical protein